MIVNDKDCDVDYIFSTLLLYRCRTQTDYYGSNDDVDRFNTRIIYPYKNPESTIMSRASKEKLTEMVHRLAYWYLRRRYPGWENGNGGKGTVVMYVENGALMLNSSHVEFIENRTDETQVITCNVKIPYDLIN